MKALLALALLALPAAAADITGFPNGFPVPGGGSYTDDEFRRAAEVCRDFYCNPGNFTHLDQKWLAPACDFIRKRENQ